MSTPTTTTPTSRAAIVGTAGHIDHGKSALIERLTGIHTDRLPEEKKRGISIELGFAFLDLESGRRVGIVDVPGHERFVKQMLAGAGGMDLVILVVAADEGVMPQTREHLDIVDLLQIPDGFVVLTKCDLNPDPDWLDIVEADIRETVAGTIFEDRPIIRASAKTGEGVDAVRSQIEERLAAGAFVARGRETRLPVDRVFTMQGFGSVVTGTLWGGAMRVGDPVTVLPEGIDTRIKTVQVHDAEVQEATAGQRVAVSLHRVGRERLGRGDWIAKSDVLRTSLMMDGWFTLLRRAPRPLKNRARVRVHLGASELLARLILLDREELRPGDEAPVQLRLESTGVAEAGDRFVVRSYSPMHTIGGGKIVSPVAGKRRRFQGDVAAEFRRLEEGTPLDRLVDLLVAAGSQGRSVKELRTEMGMPAPEFAELAREARATTRVVGENRLFTAAAVEDGVARILTDIESYHADHPYRWGTSVGDLKGRTARVMHPGLFDLARERLVTESRVSERNEQIALADRGDDLPPGAIETMERLRSVFVDGGFAPTEVDRVLRDFDDPHGPDLLSRLIFDGHLVQISQDFVFPREKVEELLAIVTRHFESNDGMTVGEAKDLLGGVTRKHVVPIMEYCDRKGWTRRDGDRRVRGGAL